MKNINLIMCLAVMLFIISCGEKKVVENVNDFKSPTFQRAYLEKGQKISEQSFNTLRMKLTEVMRENSIDGAMSYCSTHAYPITDSLSKVFDAEIRRTSLKFRNPKNEPTAKEKEILELFEKIHADGKKINDSLIKISDSKVWYVRPIYAQGICQNCHGTVGSTVAENNYNVIKKLYPEDKAVNYRSGDLRGMWSIILNVKKEK